MGIQLLTQHKIFTKISFTSNFVQGRNHTWKLIRMIGIRTMVQLKNLVLVYKSHYKIKGLQLVIRSIRKTYNSTNGLFVLAQRELQLWSQRRDQVIQWWKVQVQVHLIGGLGLIKNRGLETKMLWYWIDCLKLRVSLK